MIVNCPTCKKQVEWISENSHRPFCCKRCQLIDLGEWASEEKVIKGESISPENMPGDNTIYFDS